MGRDEADILNIVFVFYLNIIFFYKLIVLLKKNKLYGDIFPLLPLPLFNFPAALYTISTAVNKCMHVAKVRYKQRVQYL